MNYLTTALLAILLLGLSLQCIHAAPHGIREDTTCCDSVIKRPMRLGNLRNFYWTSLGCRINAVVFVTLNDTKVCADPKAKWAKRAMKHLKTKK